MNLLESTHLWIPWVYLMDSGVPGPTVAISACTHGGEHAWLKAINDLVENVEIEKHLIKWKVFFILTNIEAYKKSVSEGNELPDLYRSLEANLNRCCTIEDMNNATTYEARRAKELEHILRNTDYHLDIHSTYSKSEAIAISTERSRILVQTTLNVDVIYENLTEIQTWKPFIDIAERNGGIWIWIEAWCELDNTWFNIWVENSLRLLSWLGLIPTQLLNTNYSNKNNVLIHVYGKIVPTGANFDTVQKFEHNNVIKAWELIWKDSIREYRVERESIIIMPTKTEAIRRNLSEGKNPEEFCFLGEIQ